jgi:hypothetical protein
MSTSSTNGGMRFRIDVSILCEQAAPLLQMREDSAWNSELQNASSQWNLLSPATAKGAGESWKGLRDVVTPCRQEMEHERRVANFLHNLFPPANCIFKPC